MAEPVATRVLTLTGSRLRTMTSTTELAHVLREVKLLARQYYELTGRPLGVTGEVAEFEAVRLLGLRLAAVREAGFDAVGPLRNGRRERFQIKGRRLNDTSKKRGRLGRLDLSKPWDAVLLVLLDSAYGAHEIYRAERPEIERALTAPGSKARNERGQLSISKLKSLGRMVWSAEQEVPPTSRQGS